MDIKSNSKVIDEKGGALGRFILRFMAKYLGKWSIKAVAFPVILYFIFTQTQSRKKILQYWKTIRKGKNLFSYYIDLYKHYFQFGMTLIDRMVFKEDFINKEMQEKILRIAEKSKGLILLCSHIGGYNIYHFFPVPKDKKLNLIMYIPQGKNSLVPEFGNNQFHFIDPTQPGQAVFDSLRALENHEMLLIMGDRVDEQGQRTKTVNIQGLNLKFPLGPWHLAYTTGASILCLFIVNENKSYQILIKDPIEFDPNNENKNKKQQIDEAVLKYASYLDEMITKYPYQWFNFAADID